MDQRIYSVYSCPECDVEGTTADDPPLCWCCGSEKVTVTARPTQLNAGYPFRLVTTATYRAEP